MRQPLRAALALVLAATGASCRDTTTPPQPAELVPEWSIEQTGTAGRPLAEAPAVRVLGPSGHPVPGVNVEFAVRAGGGSLRGSPARTDANGVARVDGWTLGTDVGFNAVAATLRELPGVEVVFEAVGLPPTCPTLLALEFEIGEIRRFTGDGGGFPCLRFNPDRSAGQQYLLMLENMPLSGGYASALFAGSGSDSLFPYTLTAAHASRVASTSRNRITAAARAYPRPLGTETHAWDFGAGPIYEHEPVPPPGGVPAPALLRADGAPVDLNSRAADPQVGDTIVLFMEAVPRLEIPRGNQKAVIRHVTEHIVIAEDVRLTTTLTREDGGYNTPLTAGDLEAIATEYAAIARAQSDVLFEGRYNTATEAASPPRITAVHSLMYASNIWGYTFSSTNYFVWDFWVATDGETRGLNQHPQRVADNLFMHEVSHMRHWGMLQREGMPPRGNRWLVEGFARFTERLPIAARLLDTATPSRTANVQLPRNDAFNGSYFRDDVPTFLNAGTPMVGGYQHSSFVFDYLADQVALAGGDWMAAVRDLLVSGGRRETLDAAVQRWLPGVTFRELFTRARIALYLDDIGTALPAWTQYHQYQLRSSRPAGSQEAADPRTGWPRIVPGTAIDIADAVPTGAAAGYVIDGSGTVVEALYSLTGPGSDNAIVSITRIH